MEPVSINSPANPLLKEFVRLQNSKQQRQKSGKIALEGPNLVREALKAGLVPHSLFYSPGFYNHEGKEFAGRLPEGAGQFVMPPQLFKKIADTETPQPVAAIFYLNRADYDGHLEGVPGLVVILDRLQDPGNMGTIIRTAAAAGADIVYYTPGCTDPYGPKVLRATAGSVFHLRLELARDPLQLTGDLKKKGVLVVAAAARTGQSYWQVDFKTPSALIVGNEASGITEDLLSEADLCVSIPLHDRVESLNAAVAAALILFEVVRQRSR